MTVTSKAFRGNMLSENQPPLAVPSPKVTLPGTYNGKHMTFSVNDDMLSKHFMFIGGTGSGKTNTIYYFIDQLRKMSADDVMIIFDTKGDFFKRFYRPGDVVIGNSKQYDNISESWNIFREIGADGWYDQNIINNAQEITCSMFQEVLEKSTSQPFFPNAARDLLAAILVCITRRGRDDTDYRKQYFYNKSLKEAFDSFNPEDICAMLKTQPDCESVLSYIGDGSGSQALGVIAEMQNIVRQIFTGKFADEGHFSIRNFVRKKGGKILFIEYDLALGSTLTPIYRLLFDLALKESLGRSKSEGNVYLVCDEFKLLPHLQHIDDGVNFGRSLGVKVLAGVQSIQQLYEIYGESRGRNIAAGFSALFPFRANDPCTRDYIVEKYGKNIVLEQYKTMNNQYVEERRDGHTVEDWDLNNLNVGEAIVGLPFSQPFRFQFDFYK